MHLNLEQEDALKELLNIGVGRAAGALNQILEKPITLHIPTILLGTASELQKKLQEFGDHSLSTVQLPFKGSYAGAATLAFPTETAPKLVEILTGAISDEDELNAMKVATLTEIGNIVLNGVMGSITNVLSGTMTPLSTQRTSQYWCRASCRGLEPNFGKTHHAAYSNHSFGNGL